MKKIILAIICLSLIGLVGCSASQTQVFQQKIFAWDDQNIEIARRFAEQIRKHWLYNYKVVEKFIGTYEFNGQKYASMKAAMDEIKVYAGKINPLTEEDIATINMAFGNFLVSGGEKVIKEGLPAFTKFVLEFRSFFGI